MSSPSLHPRDLTPAQLARTQALNDYLRARITTHGPMCFADFMATCLYHPQWGYYTSQECIIGQQGDFITAPALTPAFGQTIANSLAGIIADFKHADIVEVGAGNGALAASLLSQLAQLDTLPRHYFIVDISPTLRQQQAETLKTLPIELYQRIHWVDNIPTDLEGIILTNELLDALPIHLYHWYQQQLSELGVIWDGQRFAWTTIEAGYIPTYIQAIANNLPDDYRIEDHREAVAWTQKAAACLKKGVILCFDYGYEQETYYHPSRYLGTLNCFHKHMSHSDPLSYPGLQDITCHVNFTAIQNAALASNLHVAGFTTQANFLMAAGLTFPPNLSIEDQYMMAQAFKKLLLPSEMGELIKVIALTKDFDKPILGF